MRQPRERLIDEMLVLRSQAGETAALELLVGRWQRRLWRHAYRLTGREDATWDAVQEAWMAVVKGIGRLNDPAQFSRWAYRIVSNKCADARRRQARQTQASQNWRCRNRTGREANATDGEKIESLQEAMQALGGEVRSILAMRYQEGFGLAEIAEILDIPEGTVKSRLFHAREKLRRIMERDR